VYALNELVQACNKQPEDAKQIANALMQKVASTNPVVKYKVCSWTLSCALHAWTVCLRVRWGASGGHIFLHCSDRNGCR
jgi:hypothetical protein